MKPVPAEWILAAEDMSLFDTRVRAAHTAPANTGAYHQWFYRADAELLRLVAHWHETRQCQHVDWFDVYWDTQDRVLEKDKARLRLRQCWGHSERKVPHHEAIGSFSLRRPKHERDNAVLWCVDYQRSEIVSTLTQKYKLKTEGDRVSASPMSYCPCGMHGRMLHRYGPKQESNPRWWVENRMLVVEADPAACGWNSDDDEVIEYDRVDDPKEKEPPVPRLLTCSACTPPERPCYKDGYAKLLPGLPKPRVWDNVRLGEEDEQ